MTLQISPVKRFINDVAIPITMIIAILTGDIIAPEVVPATAPVLVASCARLGPYVGRVATAIGVEEIYRRVTNFFSEKDGGGNKDSESSSWHKAYKAYNNSKFWDSLKTGNIIKGKIVHFGENMNQQWHTFRHVIENNINPAQVRKLIEQDLSNNLNRITPNKVLQQTIKFDGRSITYRAYEHLFGKIKIGSIRIGK